MTGAYPPGPPQPGPPQNISVGGPGGIQIQGTNIVTPGGVVAPPGPQTHVYQAGYPQAQHPQQAIAAQAHPASHALPAQQTGELQKMAKKNPKGAALALAGAGVAMLVLPLIILPALGFGLGLYVLPAVFSLLPFGGAAWMLKKGASNEPEALSPAREQQLLELAMRTGGALTVTQTAHSLRISLEEAEAALMDLARNGHVEIDNDDDTGAVIYVFPEIKPAPALPGASS